MAKAVKLRTPDGVDVYVQTDSVACMFAINAGVRFYVGHSMEVDVVGDIDDLAELIWGDRDNMPKRPSRRNLREGTVVGYVIPKNQVPDETPVRGVP